MREITIGFVKTSSNGDPVRLQEARDVLARLRSAWRRSANHALPDRFADLYVAVDAEIDRVMGNIAVPVPCAKGCNHCCQFNEIYVTQYEGVLLVRHIEQLDPKHRTEVVARILAATSRSGGGSRSPCTLLDANGCSVYASRPLPCRGYYSISEPACRDRLHRNGKDPPNLAATRVVEFAALEVSSAAKRPPYEVNTLLHRIYSDPAKIALWACGQATDEADLAVWPGTLK